MSGTNDDLIRRFADYQRLRGFSERTVDRRTWTLGKLDEHVAGRPLLEVDRDDVEGFLAGYTSAQTRYSLRADVRQFFRWAIGRNLVEVNPTDRVDPPRLPRRAASPLSRDDLARAIAMANDHQRLCLILGAYAGLRISEIARLRYEDVRRDEGILVVRGGKGAKDRVVPLAARIAEELDPEGRGPIFAGTGPTAGQSIGDSIRRAFRRADVRARPHDLRHTFGTEAARAANGNIVLVAQLMGHDSIATTQRYLSWSPAGADVVQAMYGT
jgi:integrase